MDSKCSNKQKMSTIIKPDVSLEDGDINELTHSLKNGIDTLLQTYKKLNTPLKLKYINNIHNILLRVIKIPDTFYAIPQLEDIFNLRKELKDKNIEVIISVCSGACVLEYLMYVYDIILCSIDNKKPFKIHCSDIINYKNSWMKCELLLAEETITKYAKMYDPTKICILGIKLPLDSHNEPNTNISTTAILNNINYIILLGEAPWNNELIFGCNHGMKHEWISIFDKFEPSWNSGPINNRVNSEVYIEERITILKSKSIEGPIVNWINTSQEDFMISMISMISMMKTMD